MICRYVLGMVALFGMVMVAAPQQAGAQFMGTFPDDPFFMYYGWFLPRQVALAEMPRPQQTADAFAAVRQQQAYADRAQLYQPVSPFALDEFDPLRPFGAQRGPQRLPRLVSRSGVMDLNPDGRGPAQYYGRAAQYYPSMRPGQSPNAATLEAQGTVGGIRGGRGRFGR